MPRALTGIQEGPPTKSLTGIPAVASTADLGELRDYVTFEDIQSLQIFKDKVLLLDHVLRLNVGVFRALQERLVTLVVPGPALTACPGDPKVEVVDIFSGFLSETIVEGHRVEHLLKRIEGASVLV